MPPLTEKQHKAFVAKYIKGIKCDCGGPQYGTAHAPDCRLLLALDDAEAAWREEVYEITNKD